MRRGGVGRRGRSMHRQTRWRVRRRRRRILLVGGAVVLGGAFAGYKLGQQDAERIEAETGRSIDQMSDEELQQAMEERGIQPEPMTDDDQAYAEAMGGSEDEEPDYLDELERLSDLKEKGVINQEEFEAKKQELLGL